MRGPSTLSRLCLQAGLLAILAVVVSSEGRSQGSLNPPRADRVPDGFAVTPPRPAPQPVPPRVHDRGQDVHPEEGRQPRFQQPGGCSYRDQTLELIV